MLTGGMGWDGTGWDGTVVLQRSSPRRTYLLPFFCEMNVYKNNHPPSFSVPSLQTHTHFTTLDNALSRSAMQVLNL